MKRILLKSINMERSDWFDSLLSSTIYATNSAGRNHRSDVNPHGYPRPSNDRDFYPLPTASNDPHNVEGSVSKSPRWNSLPERFTPRGGEWCKRTKYASLRGCWWPFPLPLILPTGSKPPKIRRIQEIDLAAVARSTSVIKPIAHLETGRILTFITTRTYRIESSTEYTLISLEPTVNNHQPDRT